MRAAGLSSWVWRRAGIFRKLLSWHRWESPQLKEQHLASPRKASSQL